MTKVVSQHSVALRPTLHQMAMSATLQEYYRLPDETPSLIWPRNAGVERGYFSFGPGVTCYGSLGEGDTAADPNGATYDASADVHLGPNRVEVPFNVDQVVHALRNEEYSRSNGRLRSNPVLRKAYYLVRPWLPPALKEFVQRRALRDWKDITFPGWPVDFTVDRLCKALMAYAIASQGGEPIPFVWFWPESKNGAVIITYDVETDEGQRFCPALMDLTEAYGFRASFQFVPEQRYPIRPEILDEVRTRGHEINIHGLNHDGRLFHDHSEFLRRAEKINAYANKFGAAGFRSPVLYRNQAWFDSLEFEYDMSVPNTGRLEAQSGGCCTGFPYFIRDLVELPVTTTQDYTLIHMLREPSIDLWRQQVERLTQESALISILGHPDYLIDTDSRKIFETFLAHLRRHIDENDLWAARPREVAAWWRERNQMRPVTNGSGWRVDGPGSERASVALAIADGSSVRYGAA